MIYTITKLGEALIKRRAKRETDKYYKVLNQKNIEDLLAQGDISKTLSILRSAIINHEPVDSIKYHTRYPFDAEIGPDDFRRATIAHDIGYYGKFLQGVDLENAILILNTLTNPQTEQKYTTLFAWNSLGLIGRYNPQIMQQENERIKEVIEHSTIGALGALLFLDRLLETSERETAISLIKQKTLSKVKENTIPKALYCYYSYQNRRIVGNPLEENLHDTPDIDIRNFLNAIIEKGYKFNQKDFEEGLRQTGLILSRESVESPIANLASDILKKPKELSFIKGTTHTKITKKLDHTCGNLLSVIGAFFNKDYRLNNPKRYFGFSYWTVPLNKNYNFNH